MTNKISGLVLVVLVFLGLGACSSKALRESENDVGGVSTVEESLSSMGMEKLIPLRIVNLLNCEPTLSTCSWKDRYYDALAGVVRANQAYSSVGIQFYIRSFEGFKMPSFSNMNVPMEPQITWSTARAELQKAFDYYPQSSFSNNGQISRDLDASVA